MKSFIVCFLVVVSLLMSGCAGLQQSMYESSLRSSRDTYLTAEFGLQTIKALPGDLNATYGTHFVTLRQDNVSRKANYEGGISALKSVHMSFDPTNDVVGRKYIAAAMARGSVVKLYQPSMNVRLISLTSAYPSSLGYNTTFSKFSDWDRALVEFDQQGRMRSALVRQEQVYTGASNIQDMYSVIVFGDIIRSLEDSAGNLVLANEFLQNIQ